jgi:hypothetical protein
MPIVPTSATPSITSFLFLSVVGIAFLTSKNANTEIANKIIWIMGLEEEELGSCPTPIIKKRQQTGMSLKVLILFIKR